MNLLSGKTLCVAIIGAGIGREHLAAYNELKDRYDVRIVCDLDEERARSIVEGDAIKVTTDLSSVLQDEDIALLMSGRRICISILRWPHLKPASMWCVKNLW